MSSTIVEATRVLLPEEVRQLRVALVADLRSLGREILRQIPAAPFAMARIDLDDCYVERLNSRQRLLDSIGWPGQALPGHALTITGDASCALASDLLTQ